jgi:hypothetical protein
MTIQPTSADAITPVAAVKPEQTAQIAVLAKEAPKAQPDNLYEGQGAYVDQSV